MTWLISGGAGYIGAHVVRAIRAASIPVVVVDDLTSGVRERVPPDVPLYVMSVLDTPSLTQVVREHGVTGLVHLAAKKQVAQSLADPLLYYRENVGGCQSLLRAMAEQGVGRLVLSSSAAVYGTPSTELVSEDSVLDPVNPYGYTKLVCERMVRDIGEAAGWDWVTLRYFNVAGAGTPALADTGGTNLIPKALEAVSSQRRPQVFGADYPTSDGTCVRDFVHVVDLAEAHVAAVQALLAGQCRETFNVGTGKGASVREVLGTVASVTGRAMDAEVQGRRPGDPARVVADPGHIGRELGWHARFGLPEMIESAWSGWQPLDSGRIRGERLGGRANRWRTR
jgi:UDP-glucose 4-epimerase